LRRYVQARRMQRDKLGRFLEAAKLDVLAARELATKKAKKAALQISLAGLKTRWVLSRLVISRNSSTLLTRISFWRRVGAGRAGKAGLFRL